MPFFFTTCKRVIKYTTLIAAILAWQDAFSAECFDRQAQSDINICLIHQAEEYTANLDTIYQTLYDKSTKAERKYLHTAKKAWDVFVAQQCAYNTVSSRGGSAHSMAVSLCYIEQIKHYTTLLEAQLHCEEGDFSCAKRE